MTDAQIQQDNVRVKQCNRDAERVADEVVRGVEAFLIRFGGFAGYADYASTGTTGWSRLRSTIWLAVRSAAIPENTRLSSTLAEVEEQIETVNYAIERYKTLWKGGALRDLAEAQAAYEHVAERLRAALNPIGANSDAQDC